MTIEQLSDFEPKGAACQAFGVLHPDGFPQRALVLSTPTRVVEWSFEAPSPGDLPGANLIFDALGAYALTGLGSAPLPPVGPADHVRGPEGAREVIVYGDYECPFCAALELRLQICRCGSRSGTSPSAPATRAPTPPPARPRRRRCRAPSGRSTTRCSPTRGGSRTRTCGRAPSGSGSTSRASTPTAAPTPWPSGCAATSAPG